MAAVRCPLCRSSFPSQAAVDEHTPKCGVNLEQRRKALSAVRSAVAKVEKAKAERIEAIRAAHAAGCSTREIAKPAGVTYQAILKVLAQPEEVAP